MPHPQPWSLARLLLPLLLAILPCIAGGAPKPAPLLPPVTAAWTRRDLLLAYRGRAIHLSGDSVTRYSQYYFAIWLHGCNALPDEPGEYERRFQSRGLSRVARCRWLTDPSALRQGGGTRVFRIPSWSGDPGDDITVQFYPAMRPDTFDVRGLTSTLRLLAGDSLPPTPPVFAADIIILNTGLHLFKSLTETPARGGVRLARTLTEAWRAANLTRLARRHVLWRSLNPVDVVRNGSFSNAQRAKMPNDKVVPIDNLSDVHSLSSVGEEGWGVRPRARRLKNRQQKVDKLSPWRVMSNATVLALNAAMDGAWKSRRYGVYNPTLRGDFPVCQANHMIFVVPHGIVTRYFRTDLTSCTYDSIHPTRTTSIRMTVGALKAAYEEAPNSLRELWTEEAAEAARGGREVGGMGVRGWAMHEGFLGLPPDSLYWDRGLSDASNRAAQYGPRMPGVYAVRAAPTASATPQGEISGSPKPPPKTLSPTSPPTRPKKVGAGAPSGAAPRPSRRAVVGRGAGLLTTPITSRDADTVGVEGQSVVAVGAMLLGWIVWKLRSRAG